MRNWKEFATAESEKPYYNELYAKLITEYGEHTCYPPFEQILNAMALTPLEKVKCVIIGQDPYHGAGQAMGLCFSVNKGVTIPPSLRNIYKEIHDELGCRIPAHGDLTRWAEQGVLLLNAILSVREHTPSSHAGMGWETYTDAVISEVNKKADPVVFMLWGNYARSKKALVTNGTHLVLEAPHPSPFSADRGFFGCGHFKSCNDFLIGKGRGAIDWSIE